MKKWIFKLLAVTMVLGAFGSVPDVLAMQQGKKDDVPTECSEQQVEANNDPGKPTNEAPGAGQQKDKSEPGKGTAGAAH